MEKLLFSIQTNNFGTEVQFIFSSDIRLHQKSSQTLKLKVLQMLANMHSKGTF